MAARKKQAALGGDWRLNAKQLRFIAEYLRDFNATQAAIRAGYSEKTARSIGSALLTNPDIAAAVEAKQQEQLDEIEASEERIILELARCAFAAPGLKPVDDWTPAELATIVGAEYIIKNAKAGDGVTDTVLKVRRADKVRSLELLARIRGMLKDKVELSGELTGVPERLIAARKKLAQRREES
jgi:phage terminase small subunit